MGTLVIAFGIQLVAAAMGFFFYVKLGQDIQAILTGIYAWGFWALGGLFTCYPARLTGRDEFGDKVKVGSMLNFSQWQTAIFLGWAIGVGAIFVYIVDLRGEDNSHYFYCWVLSWFDTQC